MSEPVTGNKQEPIYHGIIPPKLLPPGQVPCYYVLCRCDPDTWQKVMLWLDDRREAWRGTCGHCGREHWADDAGGA